MLPAASKIDAFISSDRFFPAFLISILLTLKDLGDSIFSREFTFLIPLVPLLLMISL